jgi:hypothetical protein
MAWRRALLYLCRICNARIGAALRGCNVAGSHSAAVWPLGRGQIAVISLRFCDGVHLGMGQAGQLSQHFHAATRVRMAQRNDAQPLRAGFVFLKFHFVPFAVIVAIFRIAVRALFHCSRGCFSWFFEDVIPQVLRGTLR